MFVLAQMKDTVRIPPNQLQYDTTQTIISILNKKFANKVVYNVGLCIVLWDILKCEDMYIYPGDGAAHIVVHFRYTVFRPLIDEILMGKVKSCSKEGIIVNMGFFDDIFIPDDSMQHPSKFNEQDQIWIWEYQNDNVKHNLKIEVGDKIRFRVMEERFVDTSPTGPAILTNEAANPDSEHCNKTPYTIIGTIAEQGLGLLDWWSQETVPE